MSRSAGDNESKPTDAFFSMIE
ncbi:hypothetical protein IL54_3371 [Sphingobium sp. ba1]|nr:hypothetical protein IL54_3371 [Sphingobium sp. ba1]